jgi:hypothetical protein
MEFSFYTTSFTTLEKHSLCMNMIFFKGVKKTISSILLNDKEIHIAEYFKRDALSGPYVKQSFRQATSFQLMIPL